MSNYPDDIRSYDNDPRSPFYDYKGQEAAEEAMTDEILTGDIERYISMFDSSDSDEVIILLRSFQFHRDEASSKLVLKCLDRMLNRLVNAEIEKVNE